MAPSPWVSAFVCSQPQLKESPINTVVSHPNPFAPPARPRTFNVSAGEMRETIDGRRAAVQRAKELSRRRRSTVNVERADKAEVLTFRGGSLDQYVFSTRGRR